jgi:hypothetical protein
MLEMKMWLNSEQALNYGHKFSIFYWQMVKIMLK